MSSQLNIDGPENKVSSPQIQNNPISRNDDLPITKGTNDLVEHEPINTSQDKSTMLKSQTSAASYQLLLPTANASTSTSNYLPDTDTVDMQSTASAIPKNNEDKTDMTCESPGLMPSASETTLNPRRGSIDDMNLMEREKHNISIKILAEKLEQEKIKTKLLNIRFYREARLANYEY